MPDFEFYLTREITQSWLCRVTATTIEVAHEIDLSEAHNCITDWVNDNPSPGTEPYIPDCEDYEVIDESG